MRILFVGQSPSKRNFDSNIAFHGTQSFKTLINWIDKARLDYFDCVFVNACTAVDAKEPTESDIALLRETVKRQPWDTKVVAVGKVAAWALRSAGIENYLELPHPSGLNRQLNDKEFVAKKVEELRDFCYRF
jgi:uracil-DNA glycosylase